MIQVLLFNENMHSMATLDLLSSVSFFSVMLPGLWVLLGTECRPDRPTSVKSQSSVPNCVEETGIILSHAREHLEHCFPNFVKIFGKKPCLS